MPAQLFASITTMSQTKLVIAFVANQAGFEFSSHRSCKVITLLADTTAAETSIPAAVFNLTYWRRSELLRNLEVEEPSESVIYREVGVAVRTLDKWRRAIEDVVTPYCESRPIQHTVEYAHC